MILPASVARQSVCELEVDAVAADIVNRRQIGRGCVYPSIVGLQKQKFSCETVHTDLVCLTIQQ